MLDGTLSGQIGQAFDRMLAPPGAAGFIVIDSAEEAMRNGTLVNPAAATVEYFGQFGFSLLDKAAFKVKDAPPGCDDQFTELMFVRQSDLDIWEMLNPKPLSPPKD